MTTRIPITKKNILVLGGAGFIGSHLCESLLKSGDNVICVDNFISSDVENIKMLLEYPNFEFVRHDINRELNFDEFPELQKFKVDLQGFQEVYNLACPTSAKDYTKLPIETAHANSLGVINSLEIAKKYKARYLLASTSSVYGEPPEDNSRVKEDYYGLINYLGPRACYNEGKRFAETLTATYRDFYKLDTRIARIFSTYGPRMLQHSGRHIPDYIQEALDGKEVVIAGAENLTYSFCYVKDLVEGLISLMASDIKDPVNFGDENTYTLNEIASKIISLTNSKAVIANQENFAYATKPALPDIAKAKTELNWLPLVSIDEGLRETVDDFQSRGRLYRPYLSQDSGEVDE